MKIIRNRIIPAVLAAIMTIGMAFGTVVPVFADDEPTETKTVKVDFTAQISGGFQFAPKYDYPVSSDEAEKYGYPDQINPADGVSVLDVLVVANGLSGWPMKPNSTDTLEIGPDGNPTKMFNSTGTFGFLLNRVIAKDEASMPTTVCTQAVKDGDLVEIFRYGSKQDKNDDYNWFLDEEGNYSRTFRALSNEPLKLQLRCLSLENAGDCENEEELVKHSGAKGVKGVGVFSIVPDPNIEGFVTRDTENPKDVTDENGNVELTFGEPGTYLVTAYGTNDCPETQIMSLTTIEVVENYSVENTISEISINKTAVFRNPFMTFTMDNDSFDKVFVGHAEAAAKAGEDQMIPIDPETNQFSLNLDEVSNPVLLAFHDVNTSAFSNCVFNFDPDNKKVKVSEYEEPVEILVDLSLEEARERIDELATPDMVNSLVRRIKSQRWEENTEKFCILAGECFNYLSEEDKTQVIDRAYFEEETGDVSADDPRNQDEIGEKEILAVSFGTSCNDSRVATIKAVEEALATTFTNYSVRRAFTSQSIINHILARDGETIDNVEQALKRAFANGVKELIVVPTHLLSGGEFEELVTAIHENQKPGSETAIESVKLAKPLLDSEADKINVAKAAAEQAAADSGYETLEAMQGNRTALVFLGRGTDHEAGEAYTQMQKIFENLGYKNVFVGTVEGEPKGTDAESVLVKVKAAGYSKVILRPLMLTAVDPESWALVFGEELGASNVTCQTNGLGTIKAVHDLYVQHAAEAGAVKEIEITMSFTDGYLVNMFKKPIIVKDRNFDAKLNIDEAFIAFHEAFSAGGADDYASDKGWITKFFGENTSAVKYYVNNEAATSTLDSIETGDFLNAFKIQDTVNGTDCYEYFEEEQYDAAAGTPVDVKLMKMKYVESEGKEVPVPVDGGGFMVYDPQTQKPLPGDIPWTIREKGNGVFAVTLFETGDYYLVAHGEERDGTPLSANATAIHVTTGSTKVTLKPKTAIYTGKPITVGKAVVIGSTGNVTYSYYTDAKCTKAVKSAVNAGTYYAKATVAADANYEGATSAPVKLTITKAKNKMTAKGKTIKASASKNKAFKKTQAFTIKKATGSVTFKQVTKNKLITVKKNGQVIVKKGLKAGKLYKITVKATAKGNANVKPVTKKVLLKVKVGK